MSRSDAAAIPAGLALYLAVVQFLFVSTWTVYVIFLPGLLKSVGLSPGLVPVVLLIDQLVFMVADICAGIATDRTARLLGRIGPLIATVTVLSCAAFLALPHVALAGSQALAIALVIVWAVTSSALRAPPWVLLGRHAARPALPWLNTIMLWGLAAAGAVAPYLSIVLKDIDPRLPFALSSMALALATAGIVMVERRHLDRPVADVSTRPAVSDPANVYFLAGTIIAALGFQIHFSFNTAGQYLRFAPDAKLEWLMPLFWVAFGIAMVPAGRWVARAGTSRMLAAGGILSALGAWIAGDAGSFEQVVAGQLAAGAGWGVIMMAAFTRAAEAGRSGREGLSLGLLFAALAGAALSRLAAAAAGLPKIPEWQGLFAHAPVMLWVVGAALFVVAARYGDRRTDAKPAGG